MGLAEGWGRGGGRGRITVIEYSADTSELSRRGRDCTAVGGGWGDCLQVQNSRQ